MKSIYSLVRRNKVFFLSLISCVVVFAIWLIALSPAIMTADSIDHWSQATIGSYNNLHPFVYSFFIAILRNLWDSPSIVALFQLFTTSLIAAVFLNYAYKKGVRLKWIIASLGALLLSVPVAIFNITLWTDIIYTQLLLVLSLLFVKQSFGKNEGRNLTRLDYLLIIALTIGVALFRHNGVIYLAVIPLVYYLSRLINLRRALILLGTLLVIFVTANYIIPSYAKIENGAKIQKEIPKAKIISQAYSKGQITSETDIIFLSKIAPDAVWSNYVCEFDYYLFWNPKFDSNFLESHTKEWNEIFFRTVKAHPEDVVNDRLCMATKLLAGSNLYSTGIAPNKSGLRETGVNQQLTKLFKSIAFWSTKMPIRLFFWNAAVYIIVFIVSGIYCYSRKLYISLWFLLINFINIIPIFMVVTSSEFRYLYSIVLPVFFIPVVILIEKAKRTN